MPRDAAPPSALEYYSCADFQRATQRKTEITETHRFDLTKTYISVYKIFTTMLNGKKNKQY